MTPRERLLHGRAIMARLMDDPDKLDMHEWFGNRKDPASCGSAACFLGWCARDPELQKEGLNVDVESRIPRYERWTGESAAARFFDLNYDQSERLVMPTRYYGTGITPENVIERIDEIIAEVDEKADRQ